MTSKSWRDFLPIHPAAELLPRMSQDELRVLGDDINKHGLREGVAILDGKLLDGINRLQAAQARTKIAEQLEKRGKPGSRFGDKLAHVNAVAQ
jgi:hypothetical protein